VEVLFLNPTSLSFIDEMFYRLPFPDLGALEKLQERLHITSDVVARFRETVNADLTQPRAMEDLHKGWVTYVETEMKWKGGANPAKRSESSIMEWNRTPTQSEDEVCFHWYTSTVKCI
jgi:hypothetical protein